MNIREKQAAIVARYLVIEDSRERLAAIVTRGRKWSGVHDPEKCEANLVKGCVSRVWLAGGLEEGCCRFRMSAESPLVQGLATFMCEIYDGESAAEIAAVEPEWVDALGLSRQLSPTRLNGLASLRRAIRDFAAAQSG